jgi:hypothetical protein
MSPNIKNRMIGHAQAGSRSWIGVQSISVAIGNKKSCRPTIALDASSVALFSFPTTRAPEVGLMLTVEPARQPSPEAFRWPAAPLGTVRQAPEPHAHGALRLWHHLCPRRSLVFALCALFAARALTRKPALGRDLREWRGGRVAEGGGLLNRYTV